MKKRCLLRIIILLFVTTMLLLMTGCLNFLSEIILSNIETSEPRETFVGSDGKVYEIINKNYFRFDTYNTVEVIISENEKFILVDEVHDNREKGIGEWIKDGVSIPIIFGTNDGVGCIHGDIIVEYNHDGYKYIDSQENPKLDPYIVKIKNDSENPQLQWWVTGYFSYNFKFGDVIPVQYKTYERSDTERWNYIPDVAYDFYSVEERTDVTFSCKEVNIQFDGDTGLGTWTVDGNTIPVYAAFDKEKFEFSVHYNTSDHRQDREIFGGSGKSIDSLEAIFVIETAPEIYFGELKQITVTKEVKEILK